MNGSKNKNAIQVVILDLIERMTESFFHDWIFNIESSDTIILTGH